jgi:hypothetical protein
VCIRVVEIAQIQAEILSTKRDSKETKENKESGAGETNEAEKNDIK